MNILHVNKFLYRKGGAESYLLDLADLQAEAGHRVAMFGMQAPENPPLRFAEHFPRHVRLEPPPDALAERFRVAGRMLHSRSAARGIAAVVAEFAPDVVHLHNIYHQLSPSVLGPLRRRGVPVVMTLHDYKLVCASYLMLDHGRVCDACVGGSFLPAVRRRCKDGSLAASGLLALESTVHRHAYDSVRVFLCPSRFLADRMAAGGLPPERLDVVGNFVDAAAVPARTGFGVGVAYAGRLSAEKGVDVLIDAMARLPEVPLEIAGDGPARADLERRAASLGARVRFHGRLERDRVLTLLRSAAVTVMPSRCHDNQPMALLEAFACGCPAVVSDLGGLPELVSSGAGLVVPANDAAALADALRRLLADPERASAMGLAARAMVLARYSPQTHLRRVEAAYSAAAAAAA